MPRFGIRPDCWVNHGTEDEPIWRHHMELCRCEPTITQGEVWYKDGKKYRWHADVGRWFEVDPEPCTIDDVKGVRVECKGGGQLGPGEPALLVVDPTQINMDDIQRARYGGELRGISIVRKRRAVAGQGPPLEFVAPHTSQAVGPDPDWRKAVCEATMKAEKELLFGKTDRTEKPMEMQGVTKIVDRWPSPYYDAAENLGRFKEIVAHIREHGGNYTNIVVNPFYCQPWQIAEYFALSPYKIYWMVEAIHDHSGFRNLPDHWLERVDTILWWDPRWDPTEREEVREMLPFTRLTPLGQAKRAVDETRGTHLAVGVIEGYTFTAETARILTGAGSLVACPRSKTPGKGYIVWKASVEGSPEKYKPAVLRYMGGGNYLVVPREEGEEEMAAAAEVVAVNAVVIDEIPKKDGETVGEVDTVVVWGPKVVIVPKCKSVGMHIMYLVGAEGTKLTDKSKVLFTQFGC